MCLPYILILVLFTLVSTNSTFGGDGLYIVLYHDNTTSLRFNTHLKGIGTTIPIKYTYNIGDTFKGFAATLDKRTFDQLLEDPHIKEIYPDGIVYAMSNSCDTVQQNVPSWGIARVSHKGNIPQGGLPEEYFYDEEYSGRGVDVYVLDTVVYIQHNDFGGRASYGANFVGEPDTDQNSHGTHIAGTAGGTTFGVAKSVSIISVKVLSSMGSGTISNIVLGIQWVTNQYQTSKRPSVVLMAIGGSLNQALNSAVTSSFNAGVSYSVAAGGAGTNACNYSPASCPEANTVAGSLITIQNIDQRVSSSNYGPCVDVFAPGATITSCSNTGPNSTATRSGTSMACAHVAGLLALILSRDPQLTPTEVTAKLKELAQRGLIDNVGSNTANLLAYNGCDESPQILQ